MEIVLTKEKWSHVLIGCGLITLCSLVKVPLYPVPFTLQTLAIFIVALTLPPRTAFGSALCYILILHPFWFLGKTGGFLLSFPIAAYLISYLARKIPPILAVFCGQIVISGLGFLWLIPYFGVTTAWQSGIAIFIPSALLKILTGVILCNRYGK